MVSRFRAEDPVAVLPSLRARSEQLLGRSVKLAIEPAHSLITVNGLNVVVFERGEAREVSFGRVSGRRAEVAAARRAFQALGGLESRGWRTVTYRFAHAPPSAERIAEALRGRLVQRHLPWAVLRSGLRTPVDIQTREDGFDLEAPIVIFGQLYQRAVEAASELTERIPLS